MIEINNNKDNKIGKEIDTRYIDVHDIRTMPKIRQTSSQMSNYRKIKFGFLEDDSIIDVDQCEYGITSKDDILYTYGIEPCCGVVMFDDTRRILFHLDGSIDPKDITNITDEIDWNSKPMVLIVPGSSCGIPGSFDYITLSEEYKKRGYNVAKQRIPATFGFISVEKNCITIGTAIDRSLDKIFEIRQNEDSSSLQLLELVDLNSETNHNKHH